MKDYYYILGVDANSTLDEVKDAYRKLSKKLHPDLNQGDKYFEARFRDVKDAFETLRDPAKRSQYNQDLKRARTNPLNEEQRRQQAYNGTGYQSGTSSPYRSKRKGPGVGLTIVFILIALIFGDYLVRSFNHPKLVTIKKDTITSVVLTKTLKHHKKKHSSKNKENGDSSSLYVTDAVSEPVKNNDEQVTNGVKSTTPVQKKSVDETNVVPLSSKPPIVNKIIPHGDILYTSNIRANATGVVNMREADSYSSAVVETIPANSKVLVLHKGSTYYKISYNNLTGYIPKWSVETK